VDEVFPSVVFEVYGVQVRDSVVVTWVLMIFLAGVSWLGTRRLSDRPGPVQNALEAIVEGMEGVIRENTTFPPRHFLAFVGTLGLFLAVANSVSLFPGVGAPTRDLSTTAALAAVVFLSVHYYGMRLVGPRRFLRTYIEPSPILLPFNIIAEVTRSIALALRLFGNMLSGELMVAVMLLLAGFLLPVPLQLFGLLIGLIQAYVFTLLAMVYITAALRPAEEPSGEDEKGDTEA
jgi:F-type H+-transporting ATPase subunit a